MPNEPVKQNGNSNNNKVITKVCYHCRSADHLLAQCTEYMKQKVQKKKQNLNKKETNCENNQPKQVIETK